jgi:O-antigen/teichoic acid export membrane protein
MATTVAKESKLLAKHSIIYMLGNFFNKIVAFLLLPVYTRFLTPHDYGLKELVGLSTEIIGTLLAATISSAIYRFYFEYDEAKDRNEVISSAIIAISGIGVVAVIILSMITKPMARWILDSADLYYFFQVAFVSLLFQSVNNIAYNFMRANLQSLKFIIWSLLRMILNIGMNIYFVCFMRIGVFGILITTLITSIIMFLFLTLPLLYRVGFHLSIEKIKKMAKFGYPLTLAQLGAFVVHLSDRFIIKAYCSIADVGLYSLGYRFGTIPANFIADPFNQTWEPRRFEIYKQENSEEIFGRIFTYFLVIISFVGLGVSILTRDVLMIIADKRFWSAYQIVPIIVIASTIFSFHYHLNMGLLINNKTKYLAYINLSNGIFILILEFIMIPKYGIWGGAYATLIAFIYKITLTYYLSSRYYKVHFEFVRISKILLSAAIIYAVCYFISFDSVFLRFFLKSCIACLFPVLLFVFGFLTENEKQKLLSFLEPRYAILKNWIVNG